MNARASTLRCVAVWLVTTAVAAGLTLLALPVAADPPRPGFEPLLVRTCAVALLACVAWLWLGSTLVLAGAVRGRPRGLGSRLLPATLRGAMLAACGVAVLSAGPVAAEPGRVPAAPPDAAASGAIGGLPLPTRPVGGMSTAAWANQVAATVASPQPSAATHVVQPGESLWSIAAQALPPGATDGEVDAYWRRIHADNREVLGPDPGLIHPGQRITLPPAR